jgi:hypothetical protein
MQPMKYRVYYLDEPDYLVVIVDAANHRAAAQHYFSQHPRNERCQIRVETKGVAEYSVQDFDAVQFMDESARASLPAVPLERGPVSEAKKPSPEPDDPAANFFMVLAVLCFLAGGFCIFAVFGGFSDSPAYVSPAINSFAAGLLWVAVSCGLRALNRLLRAVSEVAKALQWMLDNWPKMKT